MKNNESKWKIIFPVLIIVISGISAVIGYSQYDVFIFIALFLMFSPQILHYFKMLPKNVYLNMSYIGLVSLFYVFITMLEIDIEGVLILTSLVWMLVAAYGILFKKETAE